MNRGVPPTALKARTGEFTPPGMTALAREKSSAETVSTRPVWQSSATGRVPGARTGAEQHRRRRQDQDEQHARERDRVDRAAARDESGHQEQREPGREDAHDDPGPVVPGEREEAREQVEQRDREQHPAED